MCPLHFMHFIWGLLTIMTAAGFISYNLLADPTSTREMTCRNVSVVRWRSSDGANQSSKKNGSLFPGIAFSRQNFLFIFFTQILQQNLCQVIVAIIGFLIWQSLDFSGVTQNHSPQCILQVWLGWWISCCSPRVGWRVWGRNYGGQLYPRVPTVWCLQMVVE